MLTVSDGDRGAADAGTGVGVFVALSEQMRFILACTLDGTFVRRNRSSVC